MDTLTSQGLDEVKFPQRYVLGDSAYAQSDFLMTPYSEAESRIDDNKCLFNIRHSSARFEMTENIYGMMKRRFPIVKYIRTKLSNAIRITTAAAILHNMALDCNDELTDDLNDVLRIKLSTYLNDDLNLSHKDWVKGAKFIEGSWWPRWGKWLKKYGGKRVLARVPGRGKHPVLCDAPGTYVIVKSRP